MITIVVIVIVIVIVPRNGTNQQTVGQFVNHVDLTRFNFQSCKSK